MFTGFMSALYQTGHLESKDPPQVKVTPTAQDQRLAQLCRQWLSKDIFSESDLANHELLPLDFPSARRRRMPGAEPEEPLARKARTAVHRIQSVDTDRLVGALEPSVGEDLDDEIDKLADTDMDEPTDKQKRERLGHPLTLSFAETTPGS